MEEKFRCSGRNASLLLDGELLDSFMAAAVVLVRLRPGREDVLDHGHQDAGPILPDVRGHLPPEGEDFLGIGRHPGTGIETEAETETGNAIETTDAGPHARDAGRVLENDRRRGNAAGNPPEIETDRQKRSGRIPSRALCAARRRLVARLVIKKTEIGAALHQRIRAKG